MRVTFLGSEAYQDRADGSHDETEGYACQVFGMTFTKGEPKDISDLPDAQRLALAHNRMFKAIPDVVANYIELKGAVAYVEPSATPAKSMKAVEKIVGIKAGAPVSEEIAELRSMCDTLGVKYHHRLGPDGLRNLLAAPQQAA